MVCEYIQDRYIGSEAIDRVGLNVQRKSHIKAKHKLQNFENKSVSFFMSQPTSGFQSVKKLCTELTGKSEMIKAEIYGNGQRILC